MDEAFSWITKTATVGSVGIWSIFAAVIVALIRQGPINRKLRNEREGNLLAERAKEMAKMRLRILVLEAEQRVDRHNLNNLEQCLDALLLMIELNPERAKEAATKVRATRAAHKDTIAAEKAAVIAAKVKHAATDEDEELAPE